MATDLQKTEEEEIRTGPRLLSAESVDEKSNELAFKKLKCATEAESNLINSAARLGLEEKLPERKGSLYKIQPKLFDGLDMTRRIDRLKTFDEFRRKFMIKRLAASGFYYSGYADMVICFDCHLRLCNLIIGDDPAKLHLKKSKHCGLADMLQQMANEEEQKPKRVSKNAVIA